MNSVGNNNTGLRKKPLRFIAPQNTEIQTRYKQMKCITMDVKKSSFGRKGLGTWLIQVDLICKQTAVIFYKR